VDAAAGKDYCADLFAVITHLAASIITVNSSYWGSIVSCANYLIIFDDYSSYCFLQACCPLLQNHANVKEVLIIARAELSYDILVVFYISFVLLATTVE
jgi:hypothetical protein